METPNNEADHVQPKTPIRVRLRYWWRVTINRELPSEEKVRDILRNLKTKGFVDFAGNDGWSLRRKYIRQAICLSTSSLVITQGRHCGRASDSAVWV